METIVHIILSLIIVATLIGDVIFFVRDKKRKKKKLCVMNKAFFAKLCSICSLVMFLIYLEMIIVGTNLQGRTEFIAYVIFLSLNALFGIFSCIFFSWEIEIVKDGLICRKLFKERKILYTDMVSYEIISDIITDHVHIKLSDNSTLKISDTLQLFNPQIDISIILSDNNVTYVPKHMPDVFVMHWHLGYKIFFLVLAACSIGFVILSLFYCTSVVGVLGLLLFIPCTIFGVYAAIDSFCNNITVYKDKLIVKRLGKRKTYYFKDIKSIETSQSGTARYIDLYFPDKKVIKVNSVWVNFANFQIIVNGMRNSLKHGNAKRDKKC